MSGKALSTNPDLQTPETYENGDTLLTVYGEFYTLKSLSSDNVEISSSTIAEFFPAMGEELEDDQLTFELTTVSNIDSAAGSKSTYYNTHRPSSDYYYNHNSSPFIKVQKNVGTSAPPVVWGNNISFTDKSVENLKKILNTPDEYKPYVKISLIFKCGLTKEIIYTKSSFADWLNNQNVRNQLKLEIKICLVKNGYPPQYSPEVFNKVMEQVENFEENSFASP